MAGNAVFRRGYMVSRHANADHTVMARGAVIGYARVAKGAGRECAVGMADATVTLCRHMVFA